MPTVHLTTGLPASGKTTRAMELLADAKGSLRRVSLDNVRAMLDAPAAHQVWTHRHEAATQGGQAQAVRACLTQGFDVVVDNTHLAARSLVTLRSVLSDFDELSFVVHDFTDVSVEECIRRDALREDPVGELRIRDMAMRHRSARRSGWQLTPAWLADRFVPVPYVPDTSLPRAVIVDIDGTLALTGARNPFDFTRCDRDTLNEPVAEAAAMFSAAGHQVILLSGRGEEYRAQTEAWLTKHAVVHDELWMRHAGDSRRDDIVKHELFDAHIRHRFHVRVSLDDRSRVVALWRRMGIACWQVNYGDF
jgi:hypothetical protein